MATISNSSVASTPLKLQTYSSLLINSAPFCYKVQIIHRKIKIITNCSDNLRVIFAAGGTGGHIYPAVAIADELKATVPRAEILFVGTAAGMESAAVPATGFSIAAVSASPLARPFFSPYNIFILPFLLIKSLFQSFKIVKDFNPHIVVGTGGFVSFPICLAAALGGVNLVIHEQNSVPGIANRALSVFADRVILAFDSSVEWFWRKEKCVVCGNPVRSSLKRYVSKAFARQHFFEGLSEGKVVLVLGGSLGANAINAQLLDLYYDFLSNGLFVIWQTGVRAFDEMDRVVKKHPRLVLAPFLHDMDLAYAASDLVISRSGAMTCYEVLATGKPCILIPSPNVAEGHQFRNACLMTRLAGARVITERELDSAALRSAVEEMLGDESLMAEMSERALKAANLNASAEISKHILSLVKLHYNQNLSCEF